MSEGVKQLTLIGVVQGGPLSPSLANIVLSELDGYLEGQGRHFARYADDFVICVRSTSAARRVKANVTRFLKKRLKLNTNPDKSRVVFSNRLVCRFERILEMFSRTGLGFIAKLRGGRTRRIAVKG